MATRITQGTKVMANLLLQAEPICFGIESRNKKFMKFAGKRVNRLVVLGYAYTKNEKHFWNCRCDCGRYCFKSSNMLRKGVVSCGCFQLERLPIKHGKAKTKEHIAYLNAKGRCECITNKSYSMYGGRGIKFLFDSFESFFKELGPAPSKQHSLDRIDVNGNYEPGNVRWATEKEQQRNKRNNRMVTCNGITKPACEWEEELGLKTGIIAARVYYGRVDSLTAHGRLPRKDSIVVCYQGQQRRLVDLLHMTSVKPDTVRARLARGWPAEKALHYGSKIGIYSDSE